MIFYIGNNCPANSLVEVEPNLFLDQGWRYKGTAWYKGYSTDCVLEDNIDAILDGYQPAGKWCVIQDKKIYHPVLRGFPLYSRNDEQTNLKLEGFDVVIYHNNEPMGYNDHITVEQAAAEIGDILIENTKNFFKYNNVSEMTLVYSAGLDTTTCWAILEQVNPNFNLSIHLPTENDTTTLLFLGTEKEYHTDVMDMLSESYWGYTHQCFYKEPNWSIGGYYAETYTYRDILALKGILNYLNKSIDDIVKENDYYFHYLKRPHFIEFLSTDPLDLPDEDSFKRYLWKTIWYDHQMWHYDNNLVFSPFADVRIAEIALKLSVEDIVRMCVNGDLQRLIVNRFKPEILSLLSDYKNELRIWGNFRVNFNESMLHPDTKLIYR